MVYTDPESGARARYELPHASREDALQRLPGAEPIEESMQWRNLRESVEEVGQRREARALAGAAAASGTLPPTFRGGSATLSI